MKKFIFLGFSPYCALTLPSTKSSPSWKASFWWCSCSRIIETTSEADVRCDHDRVDGKKSTKAR